MKLLSIPLELLPGIGPAVAQKFAKLHITLVKDLLYHFPFRYQDFSKIVLIRDVVEGESNVVFGIIQKVSVRKTPRRHMWLVEVTIVDESGALKAVWFNQKYIAATLKEGMGVNLAGKVSFEGKKAVMVSPVYEIISKNTQETHHTGRIVPVYPETKGITSRGIRLFMSKVIARLDEVDEFLPHDMLQKHNFPFIRQAFQHVHFPDTLKEAQLAIDRFAFQDLFLLQLLKTSEKKRLYTHKAIAVPYNAERIKAHTASLPFELTRAQKKALDDILKDLAKKHPTSRLLQGDVGSGKTIVVALATLAAAQEGHQVVFMAPTEILAQQHYKTFLSFFGSFNDGVGLLTSATTKWFFGEGLEDTPSKKDMLQALKAGRLKILIGTHAIIQKNVQFKDVALVIIDEQHRFGVSQRAMLTDGHKKSATLPHFISMSATPIPRTLALSVFGDLDLSIIDQLPKDRKPIITKIVSPSQRPAAYAFIEKQVQQGRQCYVICPRIEQPDQESPLSPRQIANLEVKSVVAEYEKLSKEIFPHLRLAMLHGRLKATEKTSIMESFKKREIDILVSTSVVEVGVDVPNATIMMIEGSQLFGLAQLYQFRGRVGRGSEQSYCFLFSDSPSANTKMRLQALVNAKSGFELAEIDLKLRGPGEFLGREQTGIPDLAMKALADPKLVADAQKEAFELLEKDPTLSNYPYLAAYLKLFDRQIHIE